MPTVHLLVKGKVQGVFFRAGTRKAAQEIGVAGWVQNTDDGDVEVMATASQEALNKLIAWCRKGTIASKVTTVEITEKEEEPFDNFVIRR